MTIKIVTDSGSDLDPEEAKKYGIIVVPNYVHFGNTAYRDTKDINTDQFYQKLSDSRILPRTAAAAPGEFLKLYEELSADADAIVSIHITKKHSAVLESAQLGKQMLANNKCRIEIIDSGGVTIWQGMVAIAAARAAANGDSLQQVLDKVKQTIDNLSGLGLLNSLKHVIGGGRVSGAIFKVESILPLKVLLTIRDYEIRPVGLVRNWTKGIERLKEFLKTSSAHGVQDVAIGYNTTPADAQHLIEYIDSLLPAIKPMIFKIGPTLGTHTGPGTLIACVVKSPR